MNNILTEMPMPISARYLFALGTVEVKLFDLWVAFGIFMMLFLLDSTFTWTISNWVQYEQCRKALKKYFLRWCPKRKNTYIL